MWLAKNKTDLIIEVWEKLDCEDVGAAELEAIETVLADQYGGAAVDSPMRLARLLADEGAELRHSEIMALHLKRSAKRPYDAALTNILKLDDLDAALASFRKLENLRRKYESDGDREGLRLIREAAIRGKTQAVEIAGRASTATAKRDVCSEAAQWLTVWLQTPEMFESWLELRRKSSQFIEKFSSRNED